MPVNSLTGRDYSGVNVLLLWLAAEERGFTSDRWLTYNRAQEAGGQVRKGETATLAVIYRDWTKQAEDSNGNKLFDADGKPQMETVPMLRQFPLFNVEQCDDLPDRMWHCHRHPAAGGFRWCQSGTTAAGPVGGECHRRAVFTPAAEPGVLPCRHRPDSAAPDIAV